MSSRLKTPETLLYIENRWIPLTKGQQCGGDIVMHGVIKVSKSYNEIASWFKTILVQYKKMND